MKSYSNVAGNWTRQMASTACDAKITNTFPEYDIRKVKTLMPDTHIWDLWMVLSESGKIANVNGFQVLIGLGRPVDNSSKSKLMYFYSKDNEHYAVGGHVLSEELIDFCEEWSGSTILREDGRLQTFYTVVTGFESQGIWQSNQKLATAIQKTSLENDKLIIHNPDFHEVIFTPEDSWHRYQTLDEANDLETKKPHIQDDWEHGNTQVNNFCFRDPKFYKPKNSGEAYLFFEANIGTSSPGNPHDGNFLIDPYLDNEKRIGVGKDDFEPGYKPSQDALKANGCIGLIILSDDYLSVEASAQHVLSSLLVADEIERANAIIHDDYLYLFFVCHGNKMTFNGNEYINRDFLIGFRSEFPGEFNKSNVSPDYFFPRGPFIPLNGNGVVLQQKSPGPRFGGQDNYHQYVYSWLVLPDLRVISYSNFSTTSDGVVRPIRSAGPTLQIKIDGLKTHVQKLKYDIKPA